MHGSRVGAVLAGSVLVLLAGAPPAAATTASSAASSASISGVSYDDLNRNGARDSGEGGWAGHEVYLLAGTRFVANATTDASGRYAFPDVPAGTYRVQYAAVTWSELRQHWVPTTTGTLDPVHDVSVTAGAVHADFGLRRIVASSDLRSPLTSATAASGLRVESFTDAVPAAQVLASLQRGALLAAEQAFTVIRFGYHDHSFCAVSVGGSAGEFSGFSATCYVSYLSLVDSGDADLFHEYGHAWSAYHAHLVQQDSTYASYVELRGLTGDPRLDSDHAWDRRELIAEDYRQLFGSPTAAHRPQENGDIIPASQVPGLAEFLAGSFSEGVPAGTNHAPAVAIPEPVAGSTVSDVTDIAVVAEDVEDVPGALVVEVAVDAGSWRRASYDAGTGRHLLTWDTRGSADGLHSLRARVTDAAGAVTESSAVAVRVTNRFRVVDLTVTAAAGKREWSATMTTVLRDSSDGAVPGATVSVAWSSGRRSGELTCVTSSTGACAVSLPVSSRTTAVTFRVAAVEASLPTYDSVLNSDADGDSDGTTITARRPA